MAWLIAACLPVMAQTGGGSSVTKSPGEPVTLRLFVNSQPSKPPVALKWEVLFPAQLMDLEAGATETGSAAADSGKLLNCTAGKPYSYACTLSGGSKPIASGPIAVFHFRIKTTAEAGTVRLTIQKTEATTADSQQQTLNNTQSTVIIR
jgi:hypothetical protein